MAYSTGPYTDQDNALALFYAWALTNGWTQRDYSVDGTGFRAHISKVIDGTERFFNLRSGVSEAVTPSITLTRGIAVNGSTAWNGTGTAWDVQTGHSTAGFSSALPAAGTADELKAAGGTYYFFATATNLTAVFDTDSDKEDFREITVGTVGGFTSYFSSGGQFIGAGVAYDARSSYCASTTLGVSANELNHCEILIPSEGWYNTRSSRSAFDNNVMSNIVESNNPVTASQGLYGSVTAEIIYNSPDPIRGNAQLAPSLVTITKTLDNEIWPIGEIEGVKFLNMTNYSNTEEYIDGADTYKFFKIYNPGPTGVAFLK